MKVFVVLCLASLVLGHGDKEFKKWAKTKAMESCFGEENMKIWTVQMKKAVAKCTQQDAPELLLPQFRAPYKTVNSLLKGNNNQDNSEFHLMYQFFKMMQQYQQNKYSNNYHQARPYSNDYNMKDNMPMPMKWMMKMMMKNKEHSYDDYHNMDMNARNDPDHMENRKDKLEQMIKNTFYNKENNNMPHNNNKFFDMFDSKHDMMGMFNRRFTRQTRNSLDLGDRLVEKLQAQKEEMEHKIGNLTCILQEVNVLDSQNEISLPAIKKDLEQYNVPNAWFKNHYEEVIDTCFEMATTLPAELNGEYAVVGDFGKLNMAQIKMYFECTEKAMARLCMNNDIKQKIEDNFGPLDDILEQSGLTESQLFPLVKNLLHGLEDNLEDLL